MIPAAIGKLPGTFPSQQSCWVGTNRLEDKVIACNCSFIVGSALGHSARGEGFRAMADGRYDLICSSIVSRRIPGFVVVASSEVPC